MSEDVEKLIDEQKIKLESIESELTALVEAEANEEDPSAIQDKVASLVADIMRATDILEDLISKL